MTRRRHLCAATVLVLVVAAACGRGDDSSSDETQSDTPTTTTAATDAESTTLTAGTSFDTAAAVEALGWADNVTITSGDGMFTFASDGIPDHERQAQYPVPVAGAGPAATEDNTELVDDPTTAQSYSFPIPTTPTYSDTTTDVMGMVGFVVSGAALNDPYEGDGTTVALENNFSLDGVLFVDACNGHPTPANAPMPGMYHYHGIPTCITDELDTPGEHSVMIGVALDGFPIYGPQDVDGEAPTDLDECNGHFGPTPEFPEGIYHYHLTTTFPYTLDCLHGEVSVPTMGPGGGMPMGGMPAMVHAKRAES